jgi:phosphoketolase
MSSAILVGKTTASSEKANDAVQEYRRRNPEAEAWACGCGPIQHSHATQTRIFALTDEFSDHDLAAPLFEILTAADRITCAAMWLVVHATYARKAHLDGSPLRAEEFKADPQGHTGGSLNMVPAYTGYMAANAISGMTRSWIMGQGHCVAAIDAVNLVLNNMSPAHAERYSFTDEGLAHYLNDFYSYRLDANGEQDSPLGSHVNAHTAGGLAEGGYLGFTELQYVHMPLPGERLVAFLSDGAFEEQRGSNWASRWWRAEDCGVVTPIMINNGRRIDQRTTMAQHGGIDWFIEYQKLNGFDPFVFDGRDPAAFVWAIFKMEFQLESAVEAVRSGKGHYPVALPYGIAVAPKGAGFHHEGTNLAHNLPLLSNPHDDPEAARYFNESARKLWVPAEELSGAVKRFQNYQVSGRPREREHPLAQRNVCLKESPSPEFRPVSKERHMVSAWTKSSPMVAVDRMFLATVQANPHLRPRIGNPDEMRSNRMEKTLEALKFRVTSPEPGMPEDILGAVITALNEEAVACAALANKGGINIIVTYEAFAPKMHGAIRQEITFARQCNAVGRPQRWLAIPLVLTSHTWENGKNEFSHQDPVMAEIMMNELPGVSRVFFVPDSNTATAVMQQVYLTQGEFWTLLVPKSRSPELFTGEEATQLIEHGVLRLKWAGYNQEQARLLLTAIGSYQLEQVLKASARLAEREVPHAINYMIEPGKFRSTPVLGEMNSASSVAASLNPLTDLYPPDAQARIFVTHTRPEPLIGCLHALNTGTDHTSTLGFIGEGGTLDVHGMLFVNRCSFAHILAEAAHLLKLSREQILSADEISAIDGKVFPQKAVL